MTEPVQMTSAEFRALNVTGSAGLKPAKVRTTKKEAAGPYHTRCVTCDEEFHTMAAEDRHVDKHDHYRYELLGVRP